MNRKTAEDNIKKIKNIIPGLVPVGSYVRGENIINDLDFITSKDLNLIRSKIQLREDVKNIKQGEKYMEFDLNNIRVNIWRYADPYEKIFLHLSRTSSKGFNIGLRIKARLAGYKLTDLGLFKDDHKILVNNVHQIFKLIGAQYRDVLNRK